MSLSGTRGVHDDAVASFLAQDRVIVDVTSVHTNSGPVPGDDPGTRSHVTSMFVCLFVFISGTMRFSRYGLGASYFATHNHSAMLLLLLLFVGF
jgi:hypothetical protein